MDTEFFPQMFETHPAMMILIEPTSGQIMSSNQAARDFYGHTIAPLKEINPLLPAEDTQMRHAIRPGKQTCIIVPNEVVSAKIHIVEVEASPITWENKTVLFGIIHDITAQKQLEEFIRQKEAQELIQKLFAVIPTPVFYKDTHGKFLACNQATEEMLGKPMAEIIGLTAFDLFPEAVAQRYHEKDLVVLLEPPHHLVYEDKVYNHSLQEERTYLSTKSAIRDGQGQIMGLVRMMIDITERVQMEEALRASEERWQYALEGSGDGIWDWNVQTNEVFYSRRWKEILGYAEDELANNLSTWERLVHPEDKATVYEQLAAHFRGEAPAQINEHRMLHQDGSYRWILARGKVMNWTEDGQPLRMVGTHTDITAQKHLQHELEAAKEKMEQLATHDFLTGLHNRVLLTEKLTEALNQRQANQMVAVMTIDMDGFKKINDNYGHQGGDGLLIEIATRLKALMTETDMVIRMGGDEFLLIIPQLESQAEAEALAKRILKSGRRQFQLGHVTISPNFSIGIALCPRDGDSPETLLVSSDQALYQAKNQGRNCYAFPTIKRSFINITT